jgi:hypothetical protein
MRRHQLLLARTTLAVLQRQQAELAARFGCGSSAPLPPIGLAAAANTAARLRPTPAPTLQQQHHQQQRWYAYGEGPQKPVDPGAAAGEANKAADEEQEPEKEEDAKDAKDDADASENDADDEESSHKIHALAAGGGPMRANLEAWLVAACLDGTRTNDPGCTFVALAPKAQLAPLVWAQSLLSSLTAPMRRALERRGEALVQAAIERDFSARDFCEGCAGAFESVMHHYGRGRWDLLSQMASPAVVRSMRAAWDDLRVRRGLEPALIKARPSRVSLAAPNVWRKAAVARLDPERAASGGGGGVGGGGGGGGINNTVPWWAAVAVEVEAQVDVALGPAGWREEERARLRRRRRGAEVAVDGEEEEEEDDAALEPPTTVERSSTRRVGYLVFARGPLPRSAAPALYSPWWLIGWY